MNKIEYNDLFDSLSYGHDADLNIAGQRFFAEWNGDAIVVYQMNEDSGVEIASFQGETKTEIVNALFDFCFLPGKTLNNSYQEIMILDIE